MEYKEIIEILKQNMDSVSDFAYEGVYYKYDEKMKPYEEQLGEFKEIDAYGGEDMGSEWYRVFHVVKHDIYIKVEGYYSSYNGTDFDNDWDCCTQVKPVLVEVTQFQKI